MLSVLHRKSLWFVIFIMLFTVKTFAQDAVNIAVDQLGDEYDLGGNGPDIFDCSGLTSYAYRQVGVELPRRAIEQSQVGNPVALGDYQRGDLLFFEADDDRPGVVTHVGIFEENNQMIHAESPDTGVVRTNISTNSWYAERFLFAQRVIEEPTEAHPWPMFQHNAQHTGFSADSLISAPLAQSWAYPTQGLIYSSPTIHNGIVYVGSGDGNIYAIGAVQGTLKWKFEGDINGVELEVKITPVGDNNFKFKAEAEGEGEGVDLTEIVNPVNLMLAIGDDAGTVNVTAELK